MEGLKPCPFCGCKRIYVQKMCDKNIAKPNNYGRAMCLHCFVTVPSEGLFDTAEEAAASAKENWNRRMDSWNKGEE